MRTHPYLRAYMAGIVVPTILLLLMVSVFATLRFRAFPLAPTPGEPTLGTALLFEAIGRAIIFPMAIVPNLWGLWNIIYVALVARRLPIGAWGALLPFVLAPGAWAVAHLAGFALPRVTPLVVIPAGVVIYYLMWKHVVARLNMIVGIS